MEMKELKDQISRLEDPRRTDRGNIRHKLEDIIIIGLSTLICGGEDFPDMVMRASARSGKTRFAWLTISGGSDLRSRIHKEIRQ